MREGKVENNMKGRERERKREKEVSMHQGKWNKTCIVQL